MLSISSVHGAHSTGKISWLLNKLIKYFLDILNYAHLMRVHLGQINAFEHYDPATWKALKVGDFVVAKSNIPFTHWLTDQTGGKSVENSQ